MGRFLLGKLFVATFFFDELAGLNKIGTLRSDFETTNGAVTASVFVWLFSEVASSTNIELLAAVLESSGKPAEHGFERFSFFASNVDG